MAIGKGIVAVLSNNLMPSWSMVVQRNVVSYAEVAEHVGYINSQAGLLGTWSIVKLLAVEELSRLNAPLSSAIAPHVRGVCKRTPAELSAIVSQLVEADHQRNLLASLHVLEAT
jgi:hypothetical protein